METQGVYQESESLRGFMRNTLGLRTRCHGASQVDIDGIIEEAVRLIKKDDSFWDSIDYAVDAAIDNYYEEKAND